MNWIIQDVHNINCALGILLEISIHLEVFKWNNSAAAAAAKLLQSCPTLCDPTEGSPPGSPVPGILQARIVEWVAISFSNAWKWKVKVKSLSHVWLVATPRTAAHQAPLSMGFSRQEYWSGVPLPPLIYMLSIYIYIYIYVCVCVSVCVYIYIGGWINRFT